MDIRTALNLVEAALDPANAFIREVRQFAATLPGVNVDFAWNDDAEVSFEHLSVEHKRRGLASKLLARLGQVADRHGVTVYLEATPIGNDIAQDDLLALYGKFGFRVVPDEAPSMVRRPSGALREAEGFPNWFDMQPPSGNFVAENWPSRYDRANTQGNDMPLRRNVSIEKALSDPRFQYMGLLEQADTRRDVMNYLIDRRTVLNNHLLLLMAFERTQDENHWKGEVLGYMRGIAGLRMKSQKRRPIPYGLYMQGIWTGPYDHDPVGEIATDLDNLAKAKPSVRRNNLTVEEIASRLKKWHEKAAQIIARGGDIAAHIQAI